MSPTQRRPGRAVVLVATSLLVTMVATACSDSGSDDDPGRLTRIDGPARVDQDQLDGSAPTDGS